MSPVAVSADRRFHRAHVKPARRRGVWRAASITAAKCAVALVALLAVVKFASFVSTSPTLKIAQVVTIGNQRISPETVESMLGGLRGEHSLHRISSSGVAP